MIDPRHIHLAEQILAAYEDNDTASLEVFDRLTTAAMQEFSDEEWNTLSSQLGYDPTTHEWQEKQ